MNDDATLKPDELATIRRLRRQLEHVEAERRRLKVELAEGWDVTLHLALIELDEAHTRLYWAVQSGRRDLFVEGQTARLLAGIEQLLADEA